MCQMGRRLGAQRVVQNSVKALKAPVSTGLQIATLPVRASTYVAFTACGAAVGVAEGLARALVTGPKAEHGTSEQAPAKVLLPIVVLGDSGVGKTTLVHRYTKGHPVFVPKPTLGADLFQKTISVYGSEVMMQIWDTGSRAECQRLSQTFFSGARASMLVYDATNPMSVEQLQFWREAFLDLAGMDDNFPFVVLANCTSSAERSEVQSTTGAVKDWCAANGGIPHFEVHTLENPVNLSAAFCSLVKLALC